MIYEKYKQISFLTHVQLPLVVPTPMNVNYQTQTTNYSFLSQQPDWQVVFSSENC